MTSDVIIDLHQVTRRFRRMVAVDDVSLSVRQGELFGILGPDGSGKTTLLRMMAAVLNPSTGTITVREHDSFKEAEAIKATIGYMPQRFGLYGDLSVRENMRFVADVHGVTGDTYHRRTRDLYDFTRLGGFRDRLAKQLSGGMKKKLALACSLIHEPAVLLLDEPTTGVDPVARRDFWDLLSGLHARGTTTVVSTPYMDEAERCNRVALLFEGRILACDTPANIKAMVPGRVIALETGDMRHAMSPLRDLPFVIDLQTYGNQLNIIISGDLDDAQQTIRRRLTEEEIAITRLETTSVRMEEAFIYLVSQARKEAEA
jgi:ABC-2 type transport system ATP-binding protein